MNVYENFLKENGLTEKLVENTYKVGIKNTTDDINYTVNCIQKLNNYLEDNFLDMKLYNVNIYEFPFVEEEATEELLLFSFKEMCIIDLMSLIFNRKMFLANLQMLVGGQDRILFRFIDSIENQMQKVKLVVVNKFDKSIEDLFTHIYITFSIEK